MTEKFELDHTPAGKNRLEIDKLHEEVADLRSWVRRWLGALGGLIGIVTAAVSIIVTFYQANESSRQTATKLQRADSALAEARRLTAERIEKETNVRIEEGKQQLSKITDDKNKVEKELRDEQALVAKKTEERRAAIAQRDKAQQEYDALQKQIAQLGQRGGQTAVAQEATAIAKDAEKTIAERKALVEEQTKARLFFFVMDERQKSRILAFSSRVCSCWRNLRCSGGSPASDIVILDSLRS